MGMRPIAAVIAQHVEEAAHLRHVRSVQVRAPHVRLMNLGRLDERIAAHLDGIAVAGEAGRTLCAQALASPANGPLFAATVRALEERDAARLDALLDVGGALPECRAGLLSAFGWVSPASLRGITGALLDAPQPWRFEVGLAACEMHGANPQGALGRALAAADPALRRRALRVAGSLARSDALEACRAALADAHEGCAYEAARSLLLLGDHRVALAALDAMADTDGVHAPAALCLLLLALPERQPQVRLARLSRDPAMQRGLVRAIGIVGDPQFVPWLIDRMRDPALARIAGEAFTMITGVDLALMDLEVLAAPAAPAGPTDDPSAQEVALDEDDSLPWPDPAKVAGWWQVHASRFPAGARFFMGAAPTPGHCVDVLRKGCQRQRRLAALHLRLLRPDMPLFNTAAPAWRQQRRLDALGH